MLGQHGSEYIGAESACRERGNEEFGVDRPSRHGAKHVLVREISPSLGKGHDVSARVLELHDRELAAKRVACEVAAGASGTLGEGGELPSQRPVEANGER